MKKMKVTKLDTKEVIIKANILNEKVFELDDCPDWAKWAVVDEDGNAQWLSQKPFFLDQTWVYSPGCRHKYIGLLFDPTDWKNSLIKRPEKVIEVSIADLERKYKCKVKIINK